MTFPQKVVVATDTALPVSVLEPIRKMEWLNEAEIHLVHVFKLLNYGDGLSFNVAFPFQQDRAELAEAVVTKMKEMATKCLPYGHIGKVAYQCLFDDNPKEKMNQYLHDHQIDLIIVATRERKGLFESSFATYLCRHASCSVLVIRPDL